MKKIFSAVIVASITMGVISYFPALLLCALAQLDSSVALIYSLSISVLMMIILPIPMLIRAGREKKKLNGIKDSLGQDSFVWKVAIYTKRQKAVAGYFGMSGEMLSIIGVLRENEYRIDIKKGYQTEIDLSTPPDIIIKAVGNREYHMLSPEVGLICKALEKLGWIVNSQAEV